MSFDPPTLPPFEPSWPAFQIWWQQVVEGLQATLNPLIDLNNDDLLTPAKKPLWVFQHSYLTGEQAGLDAQATTLGITTEKTAYDNSITALTTYLATLTTPFLWNDFSGNTDVVGVDLRDAFNDVLLAKQALINAMTNASSGDAAAAMAAANAAQATANSASSSAATAQSVADTVNRNDKLTASSVIPANVLSASDAGSSATITIAAHTRVYGDGSQLAVAGGSITGRPYSTSHAVYYDDSTLSDTTPSYASTTTPSNALNNFVAGRHYVGLVKTPAAAAAPTTGGSSPPGTGGDDREQFSNL